jgi:hypothetical protein
MSPRAGTVPQSLSGVTRKCHGTTQRGVRRGPDAAHDDCDHDHHKDERAKRVADRRVAARARRGHGSCGLEMRSGIHTVVGGMYCARRRGWHSQLAALRQLNVLPLEMQVAEVGQQKAKLPREMWIEKYNGRPRPPRNSTVRPNLKALTWRQFRSIFQECPCMRRCNFPTPVLQRCVPMLTSIPTRIWLYGCHGSGHA